MVVKPLDSATAVRAAELRAAYGVRVPDALHLATAVVSGAEIFITNDRGLKRVKGIEVYDLKEALDYFHLGDKAT
jgi:predicted nucleic acid-binding protein